MDILNTLNKKVKFNPQRVYQIIARQAGRDLNNLSEPCAKVHTKVFEAQLYRELGVTQKFVRDIAKENAKESGPKGQKSNVVRVPLTFILSYIYYRFVKINKQKMAEDIILYTLVKHYGSVFEKHLPVGCQENVFRYTIDNIVKVHLFYREKTIPNALLFLSKALNKRFYTRIKKGDWNAELMVDYMKEARHRVAQSTRSFMQAYYRNSELGIGTSAQKEAGEDDENRNMFQTTTSTGGGAAIEKFLKSMFVYKNYDKKSIDEAKRASRVKPNLAEMIITMIHDRSSEENVKIILTSFLKNILDSKSLCGPDFFKIVKSRMLKRDLKRDPYVFKNLVIGFTNSMLDSSDRSIISPVSSRDQKPLELFVAFYITLRFRNLFC
jgi:hypothetical protein